MSNEIPELVLRCDEHPEYDGFDWRRAGHDCLKCERVRLIAEKEREVEALEEGTLARTCAEAALTMAKWPAWMQRTARFEGRS